VDENSRNFHSCEPGTHIAKKAQIFIHGVRMEALAPGGLRLERAGEDRQARIALDV
jgi:hypothetical protein